MKLLVIFIVCNIINVIIQTVKSIATIKCGKTVAAIVNALAYGFYTYIVILMVCELPLLAKCLIVGACNLIGVYVVKWAEEKSRKDKLWRVDLTVPMQYADALHFDLKQIDISHAYIPNIGKYSKFEVYCPTQKESHAVREIAKQYNAKYFVTESLSL